MNVLLLCTKFSETENNGWLTNELANEFAKLGHFVQVICIDWAAKPGKTPKEIITTSGVKAIILSPISMNIFGARAGKAFKWLISSLNARKIVIEKSREQKFDLLIGFSPAVTMMASVLALINRKNLKSYFILWDFFPYHHYQIGLIKNRLVFFLAKKLEEYLIRRYDVIGCMTKKNIDYLKKNYFLKSHQKTQILPLWGVSTLIDDHDRSKVRAEFKLPSQKTLAIFGGQLTIGRGIEEILDLANIAQKNEDDLLFIFVGAGPYENLIKEKIAAGASNVILLSWIQREKYLQLLSACDIALVCTTRNVDVPTFPSKTIDYFKASLPIVASVEKSTDYGEWIERKKFGYSSISGDLENFYENIKKLSNDPVTRSFFGKNGNKYFREKMSASMACNSILKNFSN